MVSKRLSGNVSMAKQVTQVPLYNKTITWHIQKLADDIEYQRIGKKS